MSLPNEPESYLNYNKASVLNKAVNMKGKKFLLVHGTADGKKKKRHDTICTALLQIHFIAMF